MRHLLWIPLALALIATALPAYRMQAGQESHGSGLHALMFGPVGLLSAGEWLRHPERCGYLAWLANPLALAAMICAIAGRWRTGLALALAALALSPLAWLLRDLPVHEGGERARIAGMGAGYWLWSLSLLLLTALIAWLRGGR